MFVRHLVITLVFASQSLWAISPPEPFEQEFKSTFSGFRVTSERSLKLLDDGRYEFSVKSKNLIARYEEKSIFWLDEAGQIFPLEHSVSSKVFGVSRLEETLFDWVALKATYTKGDTIRTIDLEPGLLDRGLYQLLIPEDLAAGITEPSYEFVDRGRIKTYTFGVIEEEEVELVDDKVLAVKMKRINDDDEKETLIWFASNQDYQLVKISHIDEDGSDYHMLLKGKL